MIAEDDIALWAGAFTDDGQLIVHGREFSTDAKAVLTELGALTHTETVLATPTTTTEDAAPLEVATRTELAFVDGQLQRMVFFDNLEQTTYVTLENVVVNESISAERFEFSVPEDVDLVGRPAVAVNTVD